VLAPFGELHLSFKDAKKTLTRFPCSPDPFLMGHIKKKKETLPKRVFFHFMTMNFL
jgi:hypothetical protein